MASLNAQSNLQLTSNITDTSKMCETTNRQENSIDGDKSDKDDDNSLSSSSLTSSSISTTVVHGNGPTDHQFQLNEQHQQQQQQQQQQQHDIQITNPSTISPPIQNRNNPLFNIDNSNNKSINASDSVNAIKLNSSDVSFNQMQSENLMNDSIIKNDNNSNTNDNNSYHGINDVHNFNNDQYKTNGQQHSIGAIISRTDTNISMTSSSSSLQSSSNELSRNQSNVDENAMVVHLADPHNGNIEENDDISNATSSIVHHSDDSGRTNENDDINNNNTNENRDDSMHRNPIMNNASGNNSNSTNSSNNISADFETINQPQQQQQQQHHQYQQQQQQNVINSSTAFQPQSHHQTKNEFDSHHMHMPPNQFQNQSNTHDDDQMHNHYQEQMFQQHQYNHSTSNISALHMNLSHHHHHHHQQQQTQMNNTHNDPHNQFKMYPSMYSLQQSNGFCSNPFNDMTKQQATFKPYKLESPISKHSNLSSGPSTPSAVPTNPLDDVYDINNPPSINSGPLQPNSNTNPIPNDDMMTLSPRLQLNNRMNSAMNQQQLTRNLSPATDDVYNFVDEEMHSMSPHVNHPSNNFGLLQQQMGRVSGYATMNSIRSNDNQSSVMNKMIMPSIHSPMDSQTPIINDIIPKKRGRKKKIRDEKQDWSVFGSSDTAIAKPITVPKERKKHDRFNGMSEEDVSKRTLPDHLAANLDIIIVGINPGLFAAFKGHHYAGPGNHFWKCLYLSGLTSEQMTAEEDYKLLDFGIGFTNMVQRATKGSADLTRKEIKEGSRLLQEKLKQFRPKIAVFNGKLIFEVFSGKKDFNFGRQPECVEGTSTYMWVMPSSSARCAQLPRAADKVPFYAALKKFRDYLNGVIPHIDESECVFSDPKYKNCYDSEAKIKKESMINDFTGNSNALLTGSIPNQLLPTKQQQQQTGEMTDISGTMISIKSELGEIPGKKKRGRPKKNRDGDDNIKQTTPRRPNQNISTIQSDGIMMNNEIQKKKRGRPKKVKYDQNTGEVIPSKQSKLSIDNGHLGNSVNRNVNNTNNSEIVSNSEGANQITDDLFTSSGSMNKCPNLTVPSSSRQQLQSQQQQQQQQQQPNLNPFNSLPINNYLPMNGTYNSTIHNNNHNQEQSSSYQTHDQRSSTMHQQQSSNSPQQCSHTPDYSNDLPTTEHLSNTTTPSNVNSVVNSPSSNSRMLTNTDFSAANNLLSNVNTSPTTPNTTKNQISQSERTSPLDDAIEQHSNLMASQIQHQNSNVTYSSYRNTPSVYMLEQQQQNYQQQSQIGRLNSENSNDTLTMNDSYLHRQPNESQQQISNQNSNEMAIQHHHHQQQQQQQQQQQSSSSQQSQSLSQSAPHAFQSQHLHHTTTSHVNDLYDSSTSTKLTSTDVTSKSLSGLESLVDQIPSLNETNNDTTSVQTSNLHSLNLLRTDNQRLNDLSSLSGESYQSSCLYSSNYSVTNTGGTLGGTNSMLSTTNDLACSTGLRSRNNDHLSRSLTPSSMLYSAALPTNATVLHSPNSPHTLTPPTIQQPTNTFSSLNNPFSVSNLTGNHNYTPTPPPSTSSIMSPYHSNLMPTMYIEPPLQMVNPLFSSHPYSQHHHPGFSATGYGAMSTQHHTLPHVQQQQSGPFSASALQTIHMPSPNYPFGYGANGATAAGYGHHQTTVHQHPAHAAAAYLTNHPMFDRIRPDIGGFGGYG